MNNATEKGQLMCPIVQRLIMKCANYETTHLAILTALKNGHSKKKVFNALRFHHQELFPWDKISQNLMISKSTSSTEDLTVTWFYEEENKLN